MFACRCSRFTRRASRWKAAKAKGLLGTVLADGGRVFSAGRLDKLAAAAVASAAVFGGVLEGNNALRECIENAAEGVALAVSHGAVDKVVDQGNGVRARKSLRSVELGSERGREGRVLAQEFCHNGLDVVGAQERVLLSLEKSTVREEG